jgi:hypothetical protein
MASFRLPFGGRVSIVGRIRKSRAIGRHLNEGPISQSLDQLAAILLRTGLDSPAAEQLLRRAFVRAAARVSASSTHRPTQSQIASVSGVSRREVRALLGAKNSRKGDNTEPTSRLAKLIDGWCNDPSFSTPRGLPRPLQHRGSKSEFDALVRKYGRDITKKTLRVHLAMLGLAREQDGQLLLIRATLPRNRYAAATSDLRFLASQLAHIDFELGRRKYFSKRVVLSAQERKSVEAMRQIAISRLGTVLHSLQSMSAEPRKGRSRKSVSPHRLLVSTTIAVESGKSI